MDNNTDFLIIGSGTLARQIIETMNFVNPTLDVVHAKDCSDITDDFTQGLVAIEDNREREKAVNHVLSLIPDFHFRWFKHPSVIQCHGVKIGTGTIIMPGAILNSGCVIGEHCLISSGVIIECDVKIGNFVNVGSGVIIGNKYILLDFMKVRPGEILSKDETNDLLTVQWLMELHPMTDTEAINYLKFCHVHTIKHKECYGKGEIMLPLWEAEKAKQNE
jgi:hypothetical protein